MTTDNQAKSLNINLKRILIILVIALVLIIGIIVSFSIAGRAYDKTKVQYKTVEIRENSSIQEVASTLKDKKIIGDEDKFVTLTNLLVHGKSYRSGTYYLSPSMNFAEIANIMINGISNSHGFTIPAGYTVEQTAAALDQAGFCDRDEFLTVVSEIDLSSFGFIDNSVDGPEKLEGFLLPTDYDCNSEANAAMIVINMLNEFDNIFTDEFRDRADELEMSVRDVITIASIIEKTTLDDKEKPAISAVIHNKLNLGMSFDGGFPDGPLCSPGIESIKAALYPEENENIYYVLSDKLDGTHVFTDNKDEYEELLKAYKAARKESE